MTAEFLTRLGLTVSFALFAFLALNIARRWGLFTLPPDRQPIVYPGIPFLCLRTLLGFLFFLLLSSLVVPYAAWLSLCAPAIPCQITIQQKGWITVAGIIVGALFIVLLTRTKRYDLDSTIWGHFLWRHLALGAATWCVSYPVMIAVGQGVATLTALFSTLHPIEQLAVQELRHVQEYPLLLLALGLAIAFIVPIVEESLFRGLLQNTLHCFLPRSLAIGLTAAIFALFHFAPEQGASNYELLASLFTLACFLGILYERQRSLWAPIALHATFNSISIAFIIIQAHTPHL